MNNQKNTAFFHCNYDDLQTRLSEIDAVTYDKTRNYLDGAVTWLSPFITHGIISTRDIASSVLARYYKSECEKILFELAWREYFHRVWQEHTDAIFSDMKHPCQSDRKQMPTAIYHAQTGINAIDGAIEQLINVGSMHNHARMWVASICCNMGNTHWQTGAKWMHYHLLDGDLASNTLSWQWIAGTFSNKRYFANQENINKFSRSQQRNTFLDIPYDQFEQLLVPDELSATTAAEYTQNLPGEPLAGIEPLQGSVALRSVWQLQAHWQPNIENQWVFVDTDLHNSWPMNDNRWAFILHWAKQIPKVRIVKGTKAELQNKLAGADVLRQEYTAINHWSMTTEERPWLYSLPTKPYKSFSQYWKQVKES